MFKPSKKAIEEVKNGRKPTKAELIWALQIFTAVGGLQKSKQST